MRKTRPNSTRHLRRKSFRALLEILEPRLLLDGSNVFARFTGELAYDHIQQSIPFSVSPNDFALSGNKTVLGFQVRRVGAGSLDPAAVAILNASGSPMPVRFSASDLTAYSQSLVIAELPYGSYTAIIASDRCSVGGFRLEVSLAGDVNGDRKVDQNELTLVRNMTGATSSSSAYRIEADSNLDGIITTFDYTQARDNLNDSTRLNPLTSVTLRATPAPVTLSNGTLATNSNSLVLGGTTLPNFHVTLETGSDGNFDNGSTNSDVSGNYSFGAIQLKLGGNSFQARVLDAFGQSSFATLNVTLDNVGPQIAIQSPLPLFTRTADFKISGQVTDNYAGVQRFESALDTGDFVTQAMDGQGNFSTSTSLVGAADGVHTIHLRATDNVGNISSRDISFTLDTRPPTITGSRTPIANGDGWNNTDVVASFLASDSLSGLGFVTVPVTFSGEGASQSVEGTAIDLAGNSASAVVGGINIDKTKPSTTNSLSGLAGSEGWYRGPVTVSLGATDNVAQVRATYYVLDNGSAQKYAGPIVVSNDGVHTLNYWSVDKADNEESHHAQNIKIDTRSPVIAVASPTLGLVTDVNATILGQVTDSHSSVASLEASVDNGTFFMVMVDSSGNYHFVTSLALDGSGDGLHTVHLRATDRAGNISSLTDVPFTLQTGLTLREGTAFEVTKQQSITIPTQASALAFTFSGPAFDVTSEGLVKDSFEVALVDAAGRTLVPTFAAQRDAFFNISEGQAAVLGSWARIDSRTVTLDLSHVTPGMPATLILRLVNNDRDINTFVNVSDVNVIPLTGQPVEQGGQPIATTLAPATIDFSHMTDVSGSFQPVYSRTSFNDATKVLSASIAAKNAGQYPVNKPLIVAIDHISDPNVRMRGADGLTPSGLPYFDFSNLVTSGTIESGSITNDRTMSFYNPGRVQFTYDLVFLGQLNRDPQITTLPNLEALLGKSYRYAVGVTDPDGDALTFSLLAAPTGMVIDSHTGSVSWSPKETDLGNQSVILHVEDGHGGSVQQQYALSVIQPPPNRPPMFTSTPMVNAKAGDLYTYQATAIDPDGDPLTFYLSQTRAVSIVNPGFENPVLAAGTYNDKLTGWSGSGSYRTWNLDGVYQRGAPEGHNAAYSFGDAISQTLTEPLQPNTLYTLSADIGFLYGSFPGASLQLWAGNTLLAEGSPAIPAPGTFTKATVKYTTSTAPRNSLLQIRLQPLGSSIGVHFDNVTLIAKTPPTATTFPPVGMTVDSTTGIVQWTPTADEVRDQNIMLFVMDNKGGMATQSFKVTFPVSALPLNPIDLAVDTVDQSGLSFDGQRLSVAGTIKARVSNLGTSNLATPFEVLFFEDRDGDNKYEAATDNKLGSTRVTQQLDAGSDITVDASLSGRILFTNNRIWAFVDSNDDIVETNESNNLGVRISEFVPPVGQFNPTVKWNKRDFIVRPDSYQVMMAPVVIDVNDDDIPDVVFTTFSGGDYFSGGLLRAISGDDGRELWTVNDSRYKVSAYSGLAVGDIDRDGKPEIIASATSLSRLMAFENDGSFKWISQDIGSMGAGSASIADLDGDGTPEIIIGNTVLNSVGTIRWQGTGVGDGGNSKGATLSGVADLDLDGVPEVVAGSSAFHADGSLYWNSPITDGWEAIGNFNADPYPEVVVVGTGVVYLLRHDGTVIWGPVSIPGGGVGAPTIADMDGDGRADIGVAGRSKFTVFNADGSIKWSRPTQDISTGGTGASVFDFDFDGKAEVVYGDEYNLWVFRGSDGYVLAKLPKGSGTVVEIPIVADVDADGHADIIGVANDYAFGNERGIFVYSDLNNTWVSSRQIWNQQTYHITNVNDDGTIPAHEQNSWQLYNSYRLNLQPDPLKRFLAPELTVSYVRVAQSGGPTTYTTRLGNGGSLVVVPGVKVAFYNGDPREGGVLLGTVVSTKRIVPGDYEDLTLSLGGAVADLWVQADDNGIGVGHINESDETNNLYHPDLGLPPYLPGKIGGSIYNDLNHDGTRNPGVDVMLISSLNSIQLYNSNTGTYLDAFLPLGLFTYGPDGNLYGATPTGAVLRYNGSTGDLIGTFASAGIINPTAMHFGPDGNLYEVDSSGSSIVRIDAITGRMTPFVAADSGGLLHPSDFVFGPDGNLYVDSVTAIYSNIGDDEFFTSVLRFDGNSGAFLGKLITKVSTSSAALNMSFGPDGKLYVAQVNQIYRFDSITGQLLNVFVHAGSGGISSIADIAFRPDGKLYVSNSATNQILRYDALSGAFVDSFISGHELFQPGHFEFHSMLEPALVGWTIYLDQNRNGRRDLGERLVTTNAQGNYAFTNLPPGNYTIAEEAKSGWQETSPLNDAYTITLSNGKNVAGLDFFNLHVPVANRSPIFLSDYLADGISGSLYAYAATAFDPDNDPLVFDLPAHPDGMTINPFTGKIIWTPATDQIGNHNVVLRVRDDRGGFGLQSFQITVSRPNTAPVILTSQQFSLADVVGGGNGFGTGGKQGINQATGSVSTIHVGNHTDLSSALHPVPSQPLIDGVFLPQPGASVILDSAGHTFSGFHNNTNDVFDFIFNGPVFQGTSVLGGLDYNSPGHHVLGLHANAGITFDLNKIRTTNPGLEFDEFSGVVGNVTQTEVVAANIAHADFWVLLDGVVKYHITDLDIANLAYSLNVPIRGSDHFLTLVSTDGGNTINADELIVGDPILTKSSSVSAPAGPAVVGVPFTFQVQAQDADGDPLSFSLGAHPVGMSIDTVLGQLSWTPGSEALGTQLFTVRVSDGQGGVATRTFNLVVVATAVNGNPIIVSTPPNKVGLGQRYLYSVQATDPDGNPLTYRLDTAPAAMIIDAAGLVAWTPSAAQLNTNSVTVRVEDGRGGFALQSFTINVTSQSVNNSPTITSLPPTIVTLGMAYKYAPVGSDPDADLLTWSLDNAPAGMSIHPRLGTVFWTPTADQVGNQSVVIRLTDSQGGETTESFVVEVKQNTPPDITSIPPTVAVVSSLYQYPVIGTDEDNDTLTYALLEAPTGMTINSGTGLVQWTPTPAQASVGTARVTIDVQDHQSGGAQQTYAIAILQTAVNQPPTITSTPAFAASVGQLYKYAVKATDPENQPIQYSIRAPIPTGMLIDASTGLFSWTPTLNQVGATSLSIVATDTQGAFASQTFQLSVTVNHSPVITSTPILQVAAGANYRYDVIANDQDHDPLTYALTQRPAGMVIDNFGRITWSPAISNIGTSHVALAVTDKLGAFVSQSFDVSVVADSQSPKVNLDVSSNPADVGSSVTFVVTASDNVKVQSLALRVNGVPVALDSNGRATLKMNVVGDVSVIATATDAAGNVGNASATVTVRDPSVTNQPVVDLDSPAVDAVLTNMTDVVGSVLDAHLLFYTLSIAPIGSDTFTEFARGTSALSHGLLGKFDPSLLSNDSYVLRLFAKNTGGLETILDREISVAGNLKLGNFKLSFTDLTIPVAGIPITVSRTYDSLNANNSEDFGFGWRLEFGNVDLRASTPKTGGEADLIYNPFKNGTRVYVTLPGGQRQGFTFHPTLAPGIRGSFLGIYLPHFDPDPGVTNQLSVPDYNLSVDSDGQAFAYSDDLPYNPASPVFGGNFVLATKDGIAYTINGTSGKLTTVLDAHGNTLTFTDAGIISSAGPQVTFDRDPQGRIVAVTDPAGKKVTYQYDAQGDLIAVNDRQGNKTQFVYDAPLDHYLTKVIDPLGHAGLRTEYDDAGRLVTMTDASGKTVQQSYDPTHSTETVKDQLGNPTTYEYDDRGNIVTETNALGGITKRTYDSGNNMLSETDPLGRTTSYTYDARANVLTETDPLGHVTHHTYQTIRLYSNLRVPLLPFFLEATTSDALGNTTTNAYEINGNLLSMTDAIGRTTRFVYDGSGNPTSLSDTGGNTTSFVYGGGGKLISQTDALGHVTTYEYDANGNQTKQITTLTTPTGIRSLVTATEYDADGQVVKVTDAEGNVTRNEYDAAGKRTASVDARGNRTRFDYSERGELIQTTYADGSTTQSVYDAAGHATAQIDQLGRRTEMKYDALGRLVERDYPDGTPNDPTDNPRTKTVYNAAGEVTAQIDERGNRTEFEYDNAGRQTLVRDALGHQSVSGYNIAGGLISQTDPLGHTTRFVLDDAGRQVETDFADGAHTSVTFDTSGRVATRTDQLGRTTHYEYDALGHLKAVVDALNQRTEYGYDEAGNLITQKDANGHITRYEYDGLGRRIATVLPLGQRSTTTYDAVGDMVSSTDFNGSTITNDYNALNQLVTQHLPGGAIVAFTYTADGQRATVNDDRGLTVYAYDSRDHLTSRKDPDGTTISYTYDLAGNRTSVTTPAGKVLYTFDTLNRTSSVSDPSGGLTQYKYDVVGNLIESDFPNNTKELRQYDSLNRLTYLENDGPSGVISSYRYTLGPTGRRNAVVENNGRRVDYSYDADDRLMREAVVDAVFGDRSFDYMYDPVGNRLSRNDSVEGVITSTYDNNDRLLTETLSGKLTQYTYDNNGNTLSKFTSALDHVFYHWDAQNRLIGADVADASGTHHSAYRYDAEGIRVSQTVDSQETRYLIDTVQPYAQVLLEYRPSGLAVVSYVYGNGLVSQNRDGVLSYYEKDGLGSTRALTEISGAVTDRYMYDTFGRTISQSGNTINSYLFAGQQRDGLTGLDYLRARYLNVTTGRFATRDSFPELRRDPQTLLRYEYAHVNPVNRVDPSGLFEIGEVMAAISIGTIISGIQWSGTIGNEAEIKRDSVNQIIGIVASDSNFQDLLGSTFQIFGSQAGNVRNFAFAGWVNAFQLLTLGAREILDLSYEDYSSSFGHNFGSDLICEGVAMAAAQVVNQHRGEIKGLIIAHETSRTLITRLGLRDAHYATDIQLVSPSFHIVLDWHSTLNPSHPIYFAGLNNWKTNRPSTY